MINAVSSNPSSTTNPVPLPDATSSVPPVMPQQPTMDMNSSTPPGPTHKPKRRKSSISPKMVLGSLFLLLLIVGGASAFVLSNQSQDTRNQASTGINKVYDKGCKGDADCGTGKRCNIATGTCVISAPKATYFPTKAPCSPSNNYCQAQGKQCDFSTGECYTPTVTPKVSPKPTGTGGCGEGGPGWKPGVNGALGTCTGKGSRK